MFTKTNIAKKKRKNPKQLNQSSEWRGIEGRMGDEGGLGVYIKIECDLCDVARVYGGVLCIGFLMGW